MGNHKKYWKSEVELSSDNKMISDLRNNEFVDELPVNTLLGNKNNLENSSTNRRDFLKYLGFSTAAATLASCEGPVNRSIPYVVQPERIIPGISNYYATSIADGYDFANVLIKTREGRPIKILNNSKAKVKSSANARVQASVLSMYDSMRLKGPTVNGEATSWDKLNKDVKSELDLMLASNSQVVLLTQTFASPTTSKLIKDFQDKYPNIRHVVYDAISDSKALDAFEIAHGKRALPIYDFSKADVIVSVGADFLGDWQGGGHDTSYVKGRVPLKNKITNEKAKMSKHFQLESNMTISGANADNRISLTPTQQKIALAKIYGHISGNVVSGNLPENIEIQIKNISNSLIKSGSKGLIITGLDDVDAHLLTHKINDLLKSISINANEVSLIKEGNDSEVIELVSDLNSGKVKGIIMCGVNPVYTMPNSDEFISGINKSQLSVCFSMKNDETASISKWAAACPHYFE